MDFGGFDSRIILILRRGILMSIGNIPGSLSQAILAGIMLVGRLGVGASAPLAQSGRSIFALHDEHGAIHTHANSKHSTPYKMMMETIGSARYEPIKV